MRMTIAIAASVRRSSPSVFGFSGCKRSPKSQLKMFIAFIREQDINSEKNHR